jgi:hypothetical protein
LDDLQIALKPALGAAFSDSSKIFCQEMTRFHDEDTTLLMMLGLVTLSCVMALNQVSSMAPMTGQDQFPHSPAFGETASPSLCASLNPAKSASRSAVENLRRTTFG